MRRLCQSWIQWIALAGLLAGCAPRTEQTSPGTTSGVESPRAAAVGHLDPAGAREQLAQPGALLLDVRNPDEWDGPLGHVEGAKLLPLPELAARIGELEAWKDQPVVVVCRSGNRSGQAARMLAEAGFSRVSNLEGGMIAWRQTEAPSSPAP